MGWKEEDVLGTSCCDLDGVCVCVCVWGGGYHRLKVEG